MRSQYGESWGRGLNFLLFLLYSVVAWARLEGIAYSRCFEAADSDACES